MKPVYSELGATERLCRLSLTLMRLQQIAPSTCLRNPSQYCGISLECSVTRQLLCLIPPVEVVHRCERLRVLVQDMYLDLKSIQTLPEKQSQD